MNNELWERVKRGLTCCDEANVTAICPEECPYYEPCYRELIRDARMLLETMEPRVLTLDELDAVFNKQQNHAWPYNSPPYLWMTVNPEIRRTDGFWICWRDIVSCLTDGSPFYTRENYNKSWKIWSKEPTDEQREAVAWNAND